VNSTATNIWPADHFREKQHGTLNACLNALDNGYKNIVLDAPVGSGKSVIITALLRYADNGWFTTPQKSLREQVQNDPILEPFVENLRARRDYHCTIDNTNCKDCSIYKSEDGSCAEQGCNYWRRKQAVMNSNISVITFSMLIVDGLIPEHINDMKVSFGNRDMVAVDEAHGLVQQTREMHAGFDINPHGMPRPIFDGGVTDSVSWDANRYGEVKKPVNTVLQRCLDYVRDIPEIEMSPQEKRCYRLAEKIKRVNKEIENGFPWVVNVEGKKYKGNYAKIIQIRPINVSGFLKNFVWNRADKRIVSTATLRYRDKPDIWLQQVGLDPKKTKVISVGMTFPPENRPVILNKAVGSMSNGGCDKYWDEILSEMNSIAKMYCGKRGICHTVSYDRAEKVQNTITEEEHPYLHDNIFVHKQQKDADVALENWLASDYDMILSPSMMEGVDLDGDKGRYNILMKVPYPARDAVTEYLLDEKSYGWHDYFDRAAVRVAQAYGRTIRSESDFSDFYVLDEDYYKLKEKAQFPEWLTEAEGYAPASTRSLFDY